MQGIIRGHGGAIKVKSKPGQGSCFAVELPCVSETVPGNNTITSPPSAREIGSVTGAVLLVEDEATLRLSVSKMLRKKGLAVIEAENGTIAVDLFRSNAQAIDVVLLDLTLPGMSGGMVLNELRQIQPMVKVIITSAYSQDWAATEIGGSQSLRYIRKPYQFSELMRLLQQALVDGTALRLQLETELPLDRRKQ